MRQLIWSVLASLLVAAECVAGTKHFTNDTMIRLTIPS